MIDTLKKLAQTLQRLRWPVVLLGFFCLMAAVLMIFTAKSAAENTYLIPSFVGLLWAVTAYGFMINFQSVPERADPAWGLFKRLKRGLVRFGYGLLALVFLGLSLLGVFVTWRMLWVWLDH